MAITKDMTIAEVLQTNPNTAKVLFELGMQCLGCPTAAGESVAEAAQAHGVDPDELVKKLNAAIA